MEKYLFIPIDSKHFELYTIINQSVINNQKLVSSMIDMYDIVNGIYHQNSFHQKLAM